MKQSIWGGFYFVAIILVSISFIIRLHDKTTEFFSDYSASVSAEVEADINDHIIAGNIDQIKGETPLGLIDHLPPYVMASILRTGKMPEHGLLKDSYDNGYDSVVESDIMIPNISGYKIYFDELLMLYSAGADGLMGTEDDIGVAVESVAVEDALGNIKSGKVNPTWKQFP